MSVHPERAIGAVGQAFEAVERCCQFDDIEPQAQRPEWCSIVTTDGCGGLTGRTPTPQIYHENSRQVRALKDQRWSTPDCPTDGAEDFLFMGVWRLSRPIILHRKMSEFIWPRARRNRLTERRSRKTGGNVSHRSAELEINYVQVMDYRRCSRNWFAG